MKSRSSSKKRHALGESNSFIAKGLGKPPRYITEHLALVDMPEPLASAYAAGKSTSPTTHYYLRNLYEKHPDQVAAWVSDQLEITRKSVDDLANELGGKSDKAKPEAAASKPSDFVRTKSEPGRTARTEESSPIAKVNFRPLLLVEIDGRSASVQLKQLPSQRGLLRIRYENDATEAEVEANRCTILSLEDGGKAIVPLVGADTELGRATG
jgi:ParB family chromosome partitioning protein